MKSIKQCRIYVGVIIVLIIAVMGVFSPLNVVFANSKPVITIYFHPQ